MGNVFKKSRKSLSDISTKALQISEFKDIQQTLNKFGNLD